jgi:hypothetical protein
MPEVHLPHLDDHDAHKPGSSGRSILKLALEVMLIGTGVFLGLAGEQWRESRGHHELAERSLKDFRGELQFNRQAVSDVHGYHSKLWEQMKQYYAAEEAARPPRPSVIGIRPAFFKDTAYTLALTTQALSHVEPSVAFAIADVYRLQQRLDGLMTPLMQSLYLNPPQGEHGDLTSVTKLYLDDAVRIEDGLLRMYDEVLPRIDHAIGESAPAAAQHE